MLVVRKSDWAKRLVRARFVMDFTLNRVLGSNAVLCGFIVALLTATSFTGVALTFSLEDVTSFTKYAMNATGSRALHNVEIYELA